MDRLIYTALTAMRSQHAAQAVTAHNLANANTTGFRRELSAYNPICPMQTAKISARKNCAMFPEYRTQRTAIH